MVLIAALVLPLVGLALLLAVPGIDVRWEHHPSHFWLVLGVAFVDTVLGLAMSEAATRRDDVRLFLVSLALLASAGFLALHALATPNVLLHEPNNGFVIATPIGLFLAAGFAAASALQPEHGPAQLTRSARRWIRWTLIAVLVAWASASLAGAPFLRRPAPSEAPTALRVFAPVAIGLYAFAAVRYLMVYLRRRRPLPLAVATACVLLAEAVLTIIVARSWHATWWEWHLLMAVAFVTILLTARAEYGREGRSPRRSAASTWSGHWSASTAGTRMRWPRWWRRSGPTTQSRRSSSAIARAGWAPRRSPRSSDRRGSWCVSTRCFVATRGRGSRAVAGGTRVLAAGWERGGRHGALRRPGGIHHIQ
jgi:hypothetical protein